VAKVGGPVDRFRLRWEAAGRTLPWFTQRALMTLAAVFVTVLATLGAAGLLVDQDHDQGALGYPPPLQAPSDDGRGLPPTTLPDGRGDPPGSTTPGTVNPNPDGREPGATIPGPSGPTTVDPQGANNGRPTTTIGQQQVVTSPPQTTTTSPEQEGEGVEVCLPVLGCVPLDNGRGDPPPSSGS
jgi:hypothetical protein